MKQTVVIQDSKVFLREGWYDYGSLIEILEAAGQLTKAKSKRYKEFDIILKEKKKRATK